MIFVLSYGLYKSIMGNGWASLSSLGGNFGCICLNENLFYFDIPNFFLFLLLVLHDKLEVMLTSHCLPIANK